MAIDICRTILNAIDLMASRGVVHRDITMQNILFCVDGDFQTLKIVDFALARVLDNERVYQVRSARDLHGHVVQV